MKHKLLFLLLLITTISGFAQIKGVVVDENDKPIPYVNIWFEKGNLATTSEENGTFALEIKNQENQLLFSALGFETKTIGIVDAEKVILKTAQIQLEEVAVTRNLSKEKKELGYYESGGFRYHMNYFINGIFFNVSEQERAKYPFVKEARFKTLSENKNAKIRMYLVEANADGSPGDNQLTEEIIIEVKKGNSKNTIDLSQRRITIPENGFFIVFEKLKIEQNKHYTEYFYKDKSGNKKKYTGMNYEPEIPLAPVKEAVGWNKQMGDKWQKSVKTMLNKPNSYENLLMKKYHDKYLVPAVNITITN